jgi:hypothetical protein
MISRKALLEALKELSYEGYDTEHIKDLITNAPTVQREGWVGLTDMQITNIGMQHQSLHQVAKAIDNELRAINNV